MNQKEQEIADKLLDNVHKAVMEGLDPKIAVNEYGGFIEVIRMRAAIELDRVRFERGWLRRLLGL